MTPKFIQPNPKDLKRRSNVRDSSKDLNELIESIRRHGIIQALLVNSMLEVIAGNRRLDAALALGLATVPAIVTDRELSDSEIRLIQLTENVQRKDLTDPELFTACTEVLTLNPTWQQQDLAKHLGKSSAYVSKHLSPARGTEEVREAFMAGKITAKQCSEIVTLSADKQNGLLVMKLSGATREELDKATRKPRVVSEVKLSSIKLPLPSGVVVTVKGEDLGGDELVEALTQARDAAIKANKESIDVKTLARVMADKAKAV